MVEHRLGDKVIICAYVQMTEDEARKWKPRIIITGEPVGERFVDINFTDSPSLDYWVKGQLVEERVFANVGEALKWIRPDLPSYLNPPEDP